MPPKTPSDELKDTVHQALTDAEHAATAVIDLGEQAAQFVPVELADMAAKFLAALKAAKGKIPQPAPPAP